jgi:transcriptional regulator with XRE-family HTH domain
MNKKEIGENIKIYRNKKNLTQQELADKIGVTWEMISRYERGVSSPLQKIDNISKALSIETRDLLEPYKSGDSGCRRVPLFTSIPQDFKFTKENAKFYYPCPDWIYELDNSCFVVDSGIVKNKTLDIKNNGVLYIVDKDVNKSNLYLVLIDSGLETSKEYLNNVIGEIVAEEVRV